MGFIKFIVWTTFSVGFGIYVSTAEYDHGTPLQQIQRLWKAHGPSEEQVRSGVKGAVDGAKAAVKATDAQSKPLDRHSAADRDAVAKLIAKRADQK